MDFKAILTAKVITSMTHLLVCLSCLPHNSTDKTFHSKATDLLFLDALDARGKKSPEIPPKNILTLVTRNTSQKYINPLPHNPDFKRH